MVSSQAFGGKLDGIQALRGFAAVLIVVYHIALVESHRLTPPPEFLMLQYFEYFGYAGVNLFFVISGFIMYWITRRHWHDPARWQSFIKKRAWRIYPVFFVCLALAYVVSYALGVRPRCLGTVQDMLTTVFLAPGGSQNCLLPQAWSLHWEVYFYLAFSVVFLIGRREFAMLASLWLVASAVLTIGGESILGKNAHHWGAYNLHFALGMFVAWLNGRGESRFAITATVVGVLWFAASAWLNAKGILLTRDLVHRLLQFGVGSALLVYGLVSLEKQGSRIPGVLVAVGDASYSLYLTHLFVFSVLRSWTQGTGHAFLPHLGWLTLMFGSALVVGFAVHYTIERPLMRQTRQQPAYVAAE